MKHGMVKIPLLNILELKILLLNISKLFVGMLMCTFQRKISNTKAEKCIYIGYKDGRKGYQLWRLITTNIFYTLDVVFIEVKVPPK